jgi:hypothetical protein
MLWMENLGRQFLTAEFIGYAVLVEHAPGTAMRHARDGWDVFPLWKFNRSHFLEWRDWCREGGERGSRSGPTTE